MTGKSTLALLALAGAIGAWVFLFEGGEQTSEETAKAQKMLLPGLKSADVRSLSITRPRDPTASAVVIVRSDEKDAGEGKGKWRVASPVSAVADPVEVDGALSTLEFLERKGAAPGADPTQVGLSPPRLIVEVERASGRAAVELGDDDVTGKQVYARPAGSNEVSLVPSYVVARLDRSATDFRDKALVTLDRWSVSRISIAGADGQTVSFKKDGEWIMDAPETDHADRSKVEDLLGAAHGAKAREFVAEPADEAALTAAGLSRPRFIVTLEAGTEKQAIEVGTRDEAAKTLFARKAGGATLVKVADGLEQHLSLDPDRWRSAALLPPIKDGIESLEVGRPGDAAPLARIARDGISGWRFVAPVTAAADAGAVDDVIRAVQDLQVVATAKKKMDDPANFGLDDRHALIVTLATPKEKWSFRLGKASARESGVFVQKEGKEAAYEVVFERAGLLRDGAAALRSRELLSRGASEVARLDVRRKQGMRSYVRLPDGGWSTPEAKADAASLDALAADLAGLRAEKLLGAGLDLSGAGLASPWLTATVGWRSEGEPPAVVELGRVTAEGDAFHARLSLGGGDAVLCTLRRALVDALDRDHLLASPAPAPPEQGASGAPAAPSGTAEEKR